MTEPTWNKEQIEKAMDKCQSRDTGCYARNKELIFAELERPAYVPRVGEAYAYRLDDIEGWRARLLISVDDCANTETERRPLTLKECGPVGRALDVAIDELREALAKIERLEAGE